MTFETINLQTISFILAQYKMKLVIYEALTNNCDKAKELRTNIENLEYYYNTYKNVIKIHPVYNFTANKLATEVVTSFAELNMLYEFKPCLYAGEVHMLKNATGPHFDCDGVLTCDYENCIQLNMN